MTQPRSASTVLLVGASSEIGHAVVRSLLEDRPGKAVLAGRPGPRRDAAVEALRQDGHRVTVLDYDADDPRATVETMVRRARATVGWLDAVVVAVGTLGSPAADRVTPRTCLGEPELHRLLTVNLVGPAVVADVAADVLAAQGHGQLVVLTSAAAVRPRQAILGYAAAKQALDTYVRGLDARTRRHGVRCVVVRPGQVSTRMTAHLGRAPLTTGVDVVARRVHRAFRRRRPVVWSPAVMGPATYAVLKVPRVLVPRSLR